MFRGVLFSLYSAYWYWSVLKYKFFTGGHDESSAGRSGASRWSALLSTTSLFTRTPHTSHISRVCLLFLTIKPIPSQSNLKQRFQRHWNLWLSCENMFQCSRISFFLFNLTLTWSTAYVLQVTNYNKRIHNMISFCPSYWQKTNIYMYSAGWLWLWLYQYCTMFLHIYIWLSILYQVEWCHLPIMYKRNRTNENYSVS